jgi:hypothetical protein
MSLRDVFTVARSFYKVDIQAPEYYSLLANYLVQNMFDAKDFENLLGIDKSIKLLHTLTMMSPPEKPPQLSNIIE